VADRVNDELLRDMERALVAIDASKPYRYEPTTSLPALSPQMQAALDAEAEMVASVVKRARQFAAELDALRAENEQLRAARAENERLRADLSEAIYLLRLFGFCTEADPDHELLLVERRQKLLDRHQ
jgi:hypothetical protein